MSEATTRDSRGTVNQRGQFGDGTRRSASSGNRFSIASTETAESSTSSQRNSLAFEKAVASVPDEPSHLDINEVSARTHNERGSHRSHKSRSGGGFLLSNTTTKPPSSNNDASMLPSSHGARRRESPREHKGKASVRTPERRHLKKTSGVGLGIGGSPLASNVTNAHNGQIDSAESIDGNTTYESRKVPDSLASGPPQSYGLDVDSAQIVNLALNLSESRKIVARRNISTPLPPTLTTFSDGTTGGSLRQYLQQQRRSSRNISPKADRGDRALTASPRMSQSQRVESPLQAAFGQDTEYQYHFSASTLARAEKAKRVIELMAQYRRLLQYVPPLKPHSQGRVVTRSPPNTAPESPTNLESPLSPTTSTTIPSRFLGRPYNPLQYVRNRKVRARERMAIDGESQGFGDVETVSNWVTEVSNESTNDGYWSSDFVVLPVFPGAGEADKSLHASPQATGGRYPGSTTKVKRPRVDWITNPADLLADVYWLEQFDNKKLIEDNRGQKLFPQNVELIRPMSRKVDDNEQKTAILQEVRHERKTPLRVDTELPKFSSVRNRSDSHHDSLRGRALHKLQKATRVPDEINRLGHEAHMFVKTPARSSSESSMSDRVNRGSRHRRSDTADSQYLGSDILEKQMLQMLAKESQEDSRRTQSIKTSGGSRPSSTRASLEVPMHHPHPSLDGLDTTAPNSPQVIALNGTLGMVPSIGLDISPSSSRGSSPVRKPALSRMRSRINPFHDRSRNHSRTHSMKDDIIDIEDGKVVGRTSLEAPITPHRRQRSESPVKKMASNATEESIKVTVPKASSVKRRAEDLPSGIKGLFKNRRNPVARVGDLLWGKEMFPASAPSSDSSADDSDLDDGNEASISKTLTSDKVSRVDSRDPSGELPPSQGARSYDLPTFTSPFERRGMAHASGDDTDSPDSDYLRKRQQAREDRKLARLHLLKPPRIDVQNASPSSSPDLAPADRTLSRGSDVSDLLDRRRSSYGVQGADAQLNSILGLPGALNLLPVTGLAKLDNNRRPSISSNRQWSISDREISTPRGPMTKREIARVRALLLSSGIKAKEIMRHAAELQDLRNGGKHRRLPAIYAEVATFSGDSESLKPVPKAQAHIIAARILTNDIQLSSRLWEQSAENFSSQAVGGLLDRIEGLQDRILGRHGLSEMTRRAADEADDVSKDIVTGQTLKVKALLETMQNMMRRRRARFRWVRRGGWVLLEWVLVGVMWWAWLVVVLIQVVRAIFSGVLGGLRWLFWM